MTQQSFRFAGWATALLVLASTASADVKLNDNFSVGGYTVGSYQYTKVDGSPASDRFDLDAVKTAFTASFKPVTGVVSLYYPGVDGNDVTVLDAYATYDCGGGYSITGGKFLSYLGYEAFDAVNMTQITYGAPTLGSMFSIPAYHSGVRIDYSDSANSFGLALVDSVYSPYSIFKGDGELIHNGGFEAYYKYTGTENLVLWAGLAYDTKGGFQPHSVLTLDFWAQYNISKEVFIAGEVANTDAGFGKESTSWLAEVGYAPAGPVSWIFRVSGDSPKTAVGADKYVQYTVCPTYKLTDNLSIRAEYSYYDYDTWGAKSFVGVQALFKF
ncbi:MAG TPA: hypothetical protein VIM71_14670 [Lacunisphaera sp.]